MDREPIDARALKLGPRGHKERDLVDGIERLVPTFDRSDDAVRIGCPSELRGLHVVLGEEAVDGGLEVDEGMEDAAFEAAFGEGGEEPFHCVQPGGGGRA